MKIEALSIPVIEVLKYLLGMFFEFCFYKMAYWKQ